MAARFNTAFRDGGAQPGGGGGREFFGGFFGGGSFGSFFEDEKRNPDTPVLDAKLSPFLNAMPALEDKAQQGDAGAAQQLSVFSSMVNASRELYDRFYSIGLNDANSSEGMEHVMKTVQSKDFGDGTDQFRDTYADYLANEAVRRDTNVTKLRGRVAGLLRAFRESFVGSLDTASGSSRAASAVKGAFAGSPGAVDILGLKMLSSLSDWEQDNGLRDDGTAETIVRKAANSLAKCRANPGLYGLGTDARALIEDSALSNGVNGTYGQSKFDDYDLAVRTLRDGITFSGSRATDLAEGLIPEKGENPEIVDGIAAAYETAYGRHLSEGRRMSEGFSDAVRKGLFDDLVRNLGASSRKAAGMAGGANMLRDFAKAVMGQMDSGGTVDISSIYKSLYYGADPTAASGSFVPPDENSKPEILKGVDSVSAKLGKAFSDIVDGVVARRSPTRYPYVTGSVSSGFSSPSGSYAEYDPETVKADVAKRVADVIGGDEELKSFAASNPAFAEGAAAEIAEFVNRINADDSYLGDAVGGNPDKPGYATGAEDLARSVVTRAVVGALSNGGAVQGLSRGTYAGLDSLRGRGRANFEYLYGNLADRIDGFLDRTYGADSDRVRVDAATAKTDDYVKYTYLRNLASGLRKLTVQKSPGEAYRVKGLRSTEDSDFRKALDGLASNLHGKAWERVVADGGLRAAKDMQRVSPLSGDKAARQAALSELVDSALSSVTNPRLVKMCREYADSRMTLEAPHLDANMRSRFSAALLPGIIRAYKLASRNRPDVSPADWCDPTVFAKYMDVVTKQSFAQPKKWSDAIHEAEMREYDERNQARLRASTNETAYREENGIGQ